MIFKVFGPDDWEYDAENEISIVNACREIGAPLDFFSINNYASSGPGVEMRSGMSGVELVKRTGIPILVTELGHTDTDIEYFQPQYEGRFSPDRQGNLIVNQIFGALLTGAIGVHVFTWEDRDYLTKREFGFGIVTMKRAPKISFDFVSKAYQIIANIVEYDPIIFTSLKRDDYDVAMYWPSQTDSSYNRFLIEQGSLNGVMERVGLRFKYFNETQLRAGDANSAKLLVLPLNQRMKAGDLQYIYENMISNGVNVLANADLPGYQDYHVFPLPSFNTQMDTIFGVKSVQIDAFNGDVSFNVINKILLGL